MDSSPFSPPLPADLTLTLTLSTSSCPSPSTAPAQLQFPRHDDVFLHPLQPGQWQQQPLKPDERGVRLVQLLLTCAAHAASADLPRADHCLRLITVLSSPSGDTMQRLASRFAAALAARLLRLRWPGLLSALNPRSGAAAEDGASVARLAFARALPYLPFARAVATATILRAVAHESAVHVVGLGWQRDPGLLATLLRGFSRLRRGPLRLKVTLVGPDDGTPDSLGSALLKEADSLDMPFRLETLTLPLRKLDAAMLKVDAGEALAVVSVLGLHELLPESDGGDHEANNADRFLSALRAMSPAAVVAVEQEADHNAARVADWFVEGLHHYGALFDSVDSAAAAGRLAPGERAAVEEMLGREIENVVAREGRERVERHERSDRWAGRFWRAGFRPAGPWRGALEEAKRVVDSFRTDGVGGYGLAAEGGRAIICWHDRPMYSVSAWQC